MKNKVLLLAVLFTLSASYSWAQRNADVPAAVQDAFKAKYPNATVSDWDWESDKKMYEAEFTTGANKSEAYFTRDGKWQKTKTDITKDQLPAAVSKALTSGEYASWRHSDFVEIDMNDNTKLYMVEAEKGLKDMILKYDASGKLVKEKKD